MRHDNGTDWVEVAGVARKTMRELARLDDDDLEKGHRYAVTLTRDAHFTDADGQVVDWRGDVWGLTIQQWNWWKGRIWATARDERISPEA